MKWPRRGCASSTDMVSLADPIKVPKTFIITFTNWSPSYSVHFSFSDLRSSNLSLATEIAKVRGGLMLWEMLGRFQAKRNCTEQCLGQSTCGCYPSKLKYYLYSSVSASDPRSCHPKVPLTLMRLSFLHSTVLAGSLYASHVRRPVKACERKFGARQHEICAHNKPSLDYS